MRKLLIIFALFLSLFVALGSSANEVCRIKTYAQVFHSGHSEMVGVSDFITESTCPAEVQKKFKDIALNFKGPLYNEYLIKNFSEDLSNFDVEFEPGKIETTSIEELLIKHIDLPKNWNWSDIRILNQTQLLLLSPQERLTVKCSNCTTSGSKNIELTISNSLSGVSRKEWVNATIVIKAKALVAKTNLAVTNQALNPNDFEIKMIESVRPERFFTDQESLIYFKLNKPLAQGTALENTDITPINLVTTTHPVQVILKNNDLILSGTAQALRPGKMGETIQLKNTLSQKSIVGKVVDFNKVLIEL